MTSTNATPSAEIHVRTMLGCVVGVLDRLAALGNEGEPFAVIEDLAPDDGWDRGDTAAAPAAQPSPTT